MNLHLINTVQSLYVMKCGDGFSCYGFEVLDRKARAVAAWSKVIPPLRDPGTREHFEECSEIMEYGARYAQKTGTRCNAELCPQLIGLEGKYIEVMDAHGERRRFKVGKSTGWMPCHLELKNARSSGGPAVYGAPFKSIHVVK